MSDQSTLHFFGVGGLPRRKKKPTRVIVSDPEESVETNSSENWSPGKTNQNPKGTKVYKASKGEKTSKKLLRSDTSLVEQPVQSEGVPVQSTNLDGHLELQNHMSKTDQIMQVGAEDELKSLPWFVKERFIQDRNQRSRSSPDYDRSTLYIPPDEFKKLSPVMKQYWHFKSIHYDKIVCFKLGKFFEIFYEDAILCHKYLDLNWMGDKAKLHVGFPEVSLAKYALVLVDLGFQVCVVEQVENEDEPIDSATDLKSSKPNAKNKKGAKAKAGNAFMGRQISSILSKGLFNVQQSSSNQIDLLSYEAQWLMAIKSSTVEKENSSNLSIGVALFDLQTMQIRLGQFTDGQTLTNLRTLLSHEKPVSVIFDRSNMTKDVLQCLRSAVNDGTASSHDNLQGKVLGIAGSHDFSLLKGVAFLKKYFTEASEMPETLTKMRCEQWNYAQAWSVFGLMVHYLEKNLLAKQVLPLCDYKFYDPKISEHGGPRMLIDSQGVRHLQLLEVTRGFEVSTEGSLFGLIDNTKTAIGRRLLKRWVCAPLTNISVIECRQQAIEDLMQVPDTVRSFLTQLELVPDVERLVASIYQQSSSSQMDSRFNSSIPLARLKEFYSLIDKLKLAKQAVAIFTHVREGFKSERLKQIVTYDTEEEVETKGLFPDIDSALSEFEALIQWQAISQWDRIPEPVKGFDAVYDQAKLKVEQVQKTMNKYLTEVRSQLGFSRNRDIRYVSCKFVYEIEIPNEQIEGNKRPADFELSSHRAGYSRFVTPVLKSLSKQMETANKQKKRAIVPFVCSMFKHFVNKKKVWQRIVSCISELDCLCSLAIFATTSAGTVCKPSFIESEGDTIFELKQMRHPGVIPSFRPSNFIHNPNQPAEDHPMQDEQTQQSQQSTLTAIPSTHQQTAQSTSTSSSFIPNDTCLGGSSNPSTILLSGPNMGGKSTLLRQVCLAVILAQIGSFVPAESFTLTPVDKIFTRLGAEDHILQGKSTFWVEMEETKAILDGATRKSLVIMDELGRGTSTFDGQAIAEAVLDYLVTKVKCRALFSTHYHALQGKYMNSTKWQKQVSVSRMDYHIDQERNKLVYLYKLTKGACPSSFGLNIAQIAGLPSTVLTKAQLKCEEFKRKYKHLLLQEEDCHDNVIINQQ